MLQKNNSYKLLFQPNARSDFQDNDYNEIILILNNKCGETNWYQEPPGEEDNI